MILLFDRCVEPFIPDLEDKDTENLLVVEGLITNETGTFRYSFVIYRPGI